MKTATLVVQRPYAGNRIFDPRDTVLNRDDCLAPYRALRRRLTDLGYDLSTQDINPASGAELILYNDTPLKSPPSHWRGRSFLLMWENAIINPRSSDTSMHEAFRKVFTWDDTFTKGSRYVKINYAQEMDPIKGPLDASSRSFCTMIAGKKESALPGELYSERLRAIRWFEENHPDEFDLYGIGWDRHTFRGGKLAGALNRISLLTKALAEPRPAWKGRVVSKFDALSRYTFCLCYENAGCFPGYITEKIIDCFRCGCIPIYLGAPNVQAYIASSAFIDRRDFHSDGELYDCLRSMGADRIASYRESMRAFLVGKEGHRFSIQQFVETVVGEMLGA